MSAIDDTMRPWLERILQDTGPLDLYDAHTHIGSNDPDGYKQTLAELLEALDAAGARAVVFPMHEPDGYRAANDVVLAAAAVQPERLVAFCRVSPHDGALPEARRALDAGARGIKLHPRAEQFGMDEPAVAELVALADERRVPVLIHAGRGIPALGENTVRLAERYPQATLILAHAAISDLAWLWRVLPSHPNVLIDTSWWNPVDLIALFALAPPANVVWASDSPYGRPLASVVWALRCALQAGCTPGAAARDRGRHDRARGRRRARRRSSGPPPGPPTRAARPAARARRLEPVQRVRAARRGHRSGRVARAGTAGMRGRHRRARSPPCTPPCSSSSIATRPSSRRHRPGCASRRRRRYMVHALNVARTPDVPLPALPAVPAPTRAEAERSFRRCAARVARQGRRRHRGKAFEWLQARSSCAPSRRTSRRAWTGCHGRSGTGS